MVLRIGRYNINLLNILGLVLFVALWWAAALKLGRTRLPAPDVVFSRFFTALTWSRELIIQGGGKHGFAPHLWYTFTRTIFGASIGIALGISVGLAMGWSQKLSYVLSPPLEAIRTIPPLAAAPFFLMWFGPTPSAQMGMLVFYCFLMLVINTTSAIRTVPPVYLQLAMTQGANRGQAFRTVILPAIVPALVGGIRVAIGVSWGIEIVVEMLGAPKGMGQIFAMLLSLQSLDLIMAGIIWIALMAVAVDFVFTRFARHITRWMPTA